MPILGVDNQLFCATPFGLDFRRNAGSEIISISKWHEKVHGCRELACSRGDAATRRHDVPS
ncbi:hypothetical protein ColKHC_10427 [Colletotrichum higginsianum]|nr:hypothetical protein ColKHC_10427 [Colletotrichum higginsianum]